MFDKLSLIIFLSGLIILLVPIIMSSRTKSSYKFVVGCNIISMSVLIIAWMLRENRTEKYDYNNALVTGQLAGGTVYASYPEMTPGLGWI